MLDVVKLGELSAVIGGHVLLKFVSRLPSQIASVYKEKHSPGVGEFDKAIGEADGGIGLAAAPRHLDKRSGPGFGKRPFKILYSLYLAVP